MEDNPELAGLLLDFLSAEGYEAETAGSGEEALELFRLTAQACRARYYAPGDRRLCCLLKIRSIGDTPIIIVSAKGEKRMSSAG